MRDSLCCWWRSVAGRDSGRCGDPETGWCSSPEPPARKASLPYKSEEDLEDGREMSSDLTVAPSLRCSLLPIPVRGGGGMGAVEEMRPGCGNPWGSFAPGFSGCGRSSRCCEDDDDNDVDVEREDEVIGGCSLLLLSEGLRGGGGECGGSFLMGTRLGMGGGAGCPFAAAADEAATAMAVIEGWR